MCFYKQVWANTATDNNRRTHLAFLTYKWNVVDSNGTSFLTPNSLFSYKWNTRSLELLLPGCSGSKKSEYSSLNEIKRVFVQSTSKFLSVYFCFWMSLPSPIVFYGLLTRWICQIICEMFHLAFKIAVNLVRVRLQWTVPFYLKSGSMLQLNLLCNIIRIYNILIWLMCASAGSASSG